MRLQGERQRSTLKKARSLTPAQLGPIFEAGLFGLTVGTFLFGPLAERIGRKRMIAILVDGRIYRENA